MNYFLSVLNLPLVPCEHVFLSYAEEQNPSIYTIYFSFNPSTLFSWWNYIKGSLHVFSLSFLFSIHLIYYCVLKKIHIKITSDILSDKDSGCVLVIISSSISFFENTFLLWIVEYLQSLILFFLSGYDFLVVFMDISFSNCLINKSFQSFISILLSLLNLLPLNHLIYAHNLITTHNAKAHPFYMSGSDFFLEFQICISKYLIYISNS